MKNNQLALFPDAIDESAQATFRTKDEVEHQKQQRRKSKAKSWTMPDVPDGPCCFRCGHWRRPEKLNDFGACRVLGRAEGRSTDLTIEQGQIVDMKEAMKRNVFTESLRTRAVFSCSAFRDAAEAAA